MTEQGFTLTSPDFGYGQPIPSRFTGEGEDTPPRLQWMHSPDATRGYALIVDDPDAPNGTFTHWVKFDIPASASGLDSGATVGIDGKNDFQADGYGGPYPPPNHGPHRYFFRLYALDIDSLGLPPGTHRDAVEQAIEGHIIDTAEWMGKYERTTG